VQPHSTRRLKEAAERCTQILGLRVAGVDMLEGKDGPQIMEVNSSPGLEGIETCTELEIAGAIVDYIAAQVDFPEIDVRQRLTVGRGYGVNEIYIPEGSNFCGQTVTENRLLDSDINVLTLYRGAKVISNPRNDRVLEAGDKQLCFGKLEAMRGMIPARTRKKRRPVVQDLDTHINDVVASDNGNLDL
jgi:ribosomal protein S6--L-glutamate ligase